MFLVRSWLRNVWQAVTARPRKVYGLLWLRQGRLFQLKLIILVIFSATVFYLMRSQAAPPSDENTIVFNPELVDFIAPLPPSNYCDAITTTDGNEQLDSAIQWAELWSYPMPKEDVILSMPAAKRCDFIKTHFDFNVAPLSKEELDYPLAYGILVHRWYIQVYYMLSAVYHPQNAYCIAVDNETSQEFKQAISLLAECFPNIHVIAGPSVRYCGNSILDGVLSCLKNLTLSDHPWKYYQYLSGVDLPLRTNLEMVRIFKRLNGSVNAEVVRMAEVSRWQRVREWIWPKECVEPKFGMPLIKSSLSATFSRDSARFFVSSAQATALRSFIRTKNLVCPDEFFWVSLAGSPQHVQMPGNFDAAKLLEAVEMRRKLERRGLIPNDSLPYYISRYQRWIDEFNDMVSAIPCRGTYVNYSCVFGVRDISYLLERPELIAHKLYITYQPAAFLCLYRKVKDRALDARSRFDDRPYGQLPGPRIMRKQSVAEWVNAV